ncbi:MAG TPA: acetyl-CoA sensor PanZ family protein [Pseudomonadales bacterium]
MPVFLETVSAPSEQDHADLQKVLADWPESLPPLHAADISHSDFLKQLLADPAQQVLGGRFNGRLIAMVWLEGSTQDTCTLRALCVRKLTRSRGVGERLLTLLGQQLDKTGQQLICDLPMPLPTRAWIGQYGFRSGDTPGRLVRPPRS